MQRSTYKELLIYRAWATCGYTQNLRWLKTVSSCNVWQRLKNSVLGVQSHLPYKVAAYPADQNSTIRKNFTVPFLKYKRLKLKLRVFLEGHSAAMVTYSVRKIMSACSPVIGQIFDTMIVTSADKEWN